MTKENSPLRAIRKYCLQCSGDNAAEVRRCAVGAKCPLYGFRMGHKPKQEPAEVEDMEGDGNE